MPQVRVLVTLRVDPVEEDADYPKEELEGAAAEAVENALKLVEANGFSHTYADDLSIAFVDAVEYEGEG